MVSRLTGDNDEAENASVRDEARGRAASDALAKERSAEVVRDGTIRLGSLALKRSDLIKFGGMIAFFIIAAAACVAIWPLIHNIFEPGGVSVLIEDVRNAGFLGVLLLFVVQLLQVIVAFIPGEVVQMAAGMMYGPWIGALIVLAGCVISSATVYFIVHKLGAPLVQAMVPKKYLGKFRHFEETGKLNVIVFILFLIPGLPKDMFTYLVPLTDMKLRPFLLITTIARIPGIVVSTYAADGLLDGRLVESIVIFAVLAIIAIVGILMRDRIINLFAKAKEHHIEHKEERHERREERREQRAHGDRLL